jgi:hypothetical protein
MSDPQLHEARRIFRQAMEIRRERAQHPLWDERWDEYRDLDLAFKAELGLDPWDISPTGLNADGTIPDWVKSDQRADYERAAELWRRLMQDQKKAPAR